ncbi:MAG: FtsX-like permease family protein, partial [Candidatus Wenzhouxiangella sp. M2_3B_020]
MHTLDRKLLRDLWRLWTQALAISLVMAGGAATVVLAVGSYRSLEETRIAYYERQRFADVFATLERAPDRLADDIARIPGVQAMETRIVKPGLLDLDRVAAPATGLFVSLPEGRPPRVNVPYLREGRMPVRDASREVVVNEGFADAHGYSPGSEFGAILDGRRYRLRIVGIALSPEFVYATGPGDLMPDDRRFGIVWMGEAALEAIFDLEGAFSSVALTIRRDAAEADVIRRLDALLASYGGEAAHGRRDQYSHAFLDHGLDMLRAMSRTLPPIFFGVALFLVNMTLGRLVLLERGQIGLMKALGYRDLTIAMHYLKFVALLAIAGIALGWSAGALLGQYVARIYAEFFSFPDLVFAPAPDVYAVAAALPVVAGALGAVQALNRVVRLPPAVAMQPAVPPTLRAGASLGRPFGVRLPPAAAMTLRTLLVHPWRAAMTLLAISGSTAILIASLYLSDSLERLIEVKYLRVERQDATLGLSHAAPEAVVREVERLPGVLAGEAVRAVPVRVRKGSIEKRVTLYGRAVSARLHRPLDTELRPVAPPIAGLALTKWLADRLGVAPGDRIEVDLLEGRRRTVALPVMGLLEDYIGMRAVIDIQALARLMGERPLADEVEVQIDDAELDALYAKVK